FLALFRDDARRLRHFEGRNGCSFGGWLRVVALRLAIDVLRRERRSVSLDEEGPAMTDLRRALRSDHGDPELGVQGRETATRLAAAIASLGTKDRLLVELHLVRGASLPAVAEAPRRSVTRWAVAASVLLVTAAAAYGAMGLLAERARIALERRAGAALGEPVAIERLHLAFARDLRGVEVGLDGICIGEKEPITADAIRL